MEQALAAAALVLAAQAALPNRVVQVVQPRPEARQNVQLRGQGELVVPPGKKLISGPRLNSHVEVDIDGVRWRMRFDQQVHPAVNVSMYRQLTTFEFGHEFPAGTVIRMNEGQIDMATGQFQPFEHRESDTLTGILVPE